MKLTVDYYDLKVTMEDKDDLTCDEMFTLCIGLMHTLGFHPDNIRDSIIEMAESYENRSDK